MIRIGWSRTRDLEERAELEALHASLRAVSLRCHTAIREAIAEGSLRGVDLRRRFDEAPAFARDHFVEEVLGIAYPPLDEPDLGPELLAYAPSGYDEIVYALDATALGREGSFVDLGSGTGKAVMLAELLTGARCAGIECNAALHALAGTASRSLGLRAVFRLADVRDAAIDDSDVVFMYLPFTGSVLASVIARVIEQRRHRFLCAGAVDTTRYRELVAAGTPQSWLHVYALR